MANSMFAEILTRLASISLHEWVNFMLAAASLLVAFGAANRMKAGETPLTIRVSFVTVGAGLIGVCFSYIFPSEWELPFDTILFGGILALLVGTRRQTILLDPRWMPAISGWCSVVTWAIFLVTVRG